MDYRILFASDEWKSIEEMLTKTLIDADEKVIESALGGEIARAAAFAGRVETLREILGLPNVLVVDHEGEKEEEAAAEN